MKSYVKILLFILPWTARTAAEPQCEACLFNTAPLREDEDCSVYSVYEEKSTLQAWYRANETCLQALNISQAAVPKDRMWGICPHANENDASNTLLTLFVRSDNSSAAQSVRSMYPDFFHNETLELNPTVPGTQGQIVNCSVSDDLCWNEFGIFFDLNPEELGRVCSQLHVVQKASLIQEQAAAREALCGTTNDTSLEVCQPLWQQIQDLSVASCESVSRVEYGSFAPPNCTHGSPEGSGVTSVGMGMIALTLLSSLFY